MADSDNETIPLLQRDTSVKDEGRDTDTTDDERNAEVEQDFSHLEQPGPSFDRLPMKSKKISVSRLRQGKDALSYFAGETLSSSDDSSKVTSASSSVALDCEKEYTTDQDGNDFVNIHFDGTISEKDVAELVNLLRLHHYTPVSEQCSKLENLKNFTISKCLILFQRDYHCEIFQNEGGNLSKHYPARLIVPVARKPETKSHERLEPADFDRECYSSKIHNSVHSRLLARFVVPVIFFDKKFICRSGSLSTRKSSAFESIRQNEIPKSQQMDSFRIVRITRRVVSDVVDLVNRSYKAALQLLIPNSMLKLRDDDAEILRNLNIEHICDLMVEDRKKFMQIIPISSSEKINRDIYKDCSIEQMPYPGCTFFKRYHEANRVPHSLFFDWENGEVDTVMKFSVDPNEIFPDINWTGYKEWDLAELTQNYLKMMLSYLAKDAGGMLVHCISGWDRTPLFISMLRVSLWADGITHRSLDYKYMAYLTLAYDWYLFGHNFPARLAAKEEILHFCFNFLEHIVNDEFSLTRIFHALPEDEKRGRVFPEYIPGRRKILIKLKEYVLDFYRKCIDKLD